MGSFKDFLRWYNNKDVVPTLETMQKRLLFFMTKISVYWSLVLLYKTWPPFPCTNLPMQNSLQSQKEIETFWKRCPSVFICVGISIQKPVDSHLDKTRPVALKIWSYLIFNEQDLIVKLRASTLQADRKKLTALVLMGFVLIAILCLKQWVAFITFVTVKSSAHLSLKKISKVAVGKKTRSIETHCHWNVGLWVVETLQDNQ